MERNNFEQVIIRKAEDSLIHNRIKCTNIKINQLQAEKTNTKNSLPVKPYVPTFTDLQNTIFKSKEKNFLWYKKTQIKKLKNLISRTSTTTYKMASETTNTFSTTVTSSNTSGIQDRWVINLSKKELIPEEKSLLKKGLKFAVTPGSIPVKEYISTTTVAACQAGLLNGVDFSGLYHDVSRIPNTYTNKPMHTNITKAEHLVLEDHGKDKDCIFVTADKGVALVVMDKTEYLTKCEFINISPKTHFQVSTKNSLKFCKTTRITISPLKQNTPNSRPHGPNSLAARFYNLLKIHKNSMPVHPIVSACGTATYSTAKFITKILQNYCGKTSSFVKNSTDFIQKIRHL